MPKTPARRHHSAETANGGTTMPSQTGLAALHSLRRKLGIKQFLNDPWRRPAAA
jgi:hypothetical protein